MLYFRLKMRHSGVSSSSSTAATERVFSSWEEVVSSHAQDMWADLPLMRRELGMHELTHSMSLYVKDFLK